MNVAAGRFRDTIVVEQISPDAVKGPGGRIDKSNDDNWCTYCTERAEVLGVGARELLHGQQTVADLDYRITVRLSEITAGITHRMRVRHGCRKLQISRVVEIGSPARLVELSCVETE